MMSLWSGGACSRSCSGQLAARKKTGVRQAARGEDESKLSQSQAVLSGRGTVWHYLQEIAGRETIVVIRAG